MSHGQGYVGNAADSARIRRLTEQREKEKADFEALKASRESRNGTRLVGFAASNLEYVEHVFKQDTVGLQTKEQFVEKRANVEREVEEQRQRAARQQEEEQLRAQGRKRAAAKVTATARLSFVDAEEEEEEAEEERGHAAGGAAPPVGEPGGGGSEQAVLAEDEQASKRLRFGSVGKNPGVNTTFLPDRDRERQEREERERLKREWVAEQQRLQAESLQITFSYWDGSGHRRSITVRRGDSVGAFLRGVRDALSPEFRELRSASVDNMLYVKEDLIIPHSLTFHELIVSKARGKSGPLFHFDVHEDIRLVADARKEKDEAHAGKVLERHWYDKNKHIFPASRWEVYDPTKDYGSYTIHGE